MAQLVQTIPPPSYFYPEPHKAFFERFAELWTKTPGWHVQVQQNDPSSMGISIVMGCPHNMWHLRTIPSLWMMESNYGRAMAEEEHRSFLNQCKSMCAVSWQPVYSLESQEPISYVQSSWSPTYTNGGLIPQFYGGGTTSILGTLLQVCPSLGSVHKDCPVVHCPLTYAPLANLIPHINDRHQWTREQIADWLDSLKDVDLTIKRVAA